MARMRSGDGVWNCLLFGVDRKWTADGQNDEIDSLYDINPAARPQPPKLLRWLRDFGQMFPLE